MNRRIRIAEYIKDYMIKINGVNVFVDTSVVREFTKFNTNKFAFARRHFSGAERIQFVKQSGYEGGGFISDDNRQIYLCAEKAQSLLNVGKKTTRFSLWVKPTL